MSFELFRNIVKGLVVYTNEPITDHTDGSTVRTALVYNGNIARDTSLAVLAASLNSDDSPEEAGNTDVFDFFLRSGHKLYKVTPSTGELSALDYHPPGAEGPAAPPDPADHVGDVGDDGDAREGGAHGGPGGAHGGPGGAPLQIEQRNVGITRTIEEVYSSPGFDGENEYENIYSYKVDEDSTSRRNVLFYHRGGEPEYVVTLDIVSSQMAGNESGTTWQEVYSFRVFAAVTETYEDAEAIQDTLVPIIERMNGYNWGSIKTELNALGFTELVRQIETNTDAPVNRMEAESAYGGSGTYMESGVDIELL